MEFTLKNEKIKLIISDFGAEMTSLTLDGFEYLWTPDEKHYNRTSPCLFPITGRFADGYYVHKDKKYYMQLNGIAMEKTFKAKKISDTELTMTLCDDDETTELYPYSFILVIRYCLDGDTVNITYDVTNRSDETMPFSVGNHTAYKWPLMDNDDPNSYFIRFEQPETLESFSPFGWRDAYVTNESIRLLNHNLYVNGTRSFVGQKSNWLEYTGANCEYVVRMYNSEFPYVANWAKPDSDVRIVCIEPTLSISSHGPTIFDREGIHILQAGETEKVSYSLKLYRKTK